MSRKGDGVNKNWKEEDKIVEMVKPEEIKTIAKKKIEEG
jgi:hypothetical protein